MASFQNRRAQAKALQEMKSRVAELQARIAKDVDYAFEALLQVQPDLSLKMESDLEEVLRIAELIKSELDEASGISELERLDRRIDFFEDRFEELEAEFYSRPSLLGPPFFGCRLLYQSSSRSPRICPRISPVGCLLVCTLA